MGVHLRKLDSLRIICIKNSGIGKKKDISLELDTKIKLLDFIEEFIK